MPIITKDGNRPSLLSGAPAIAQNAPAMNKVVVGMSGALQQRCGGLLKEQGYDVIGVTMKLHNTFQADGGCCSVFNANDALRVAQK